ncbi:MAG TPA: tetratricopeptide repeat protein [Gemmatimonadaceae bacterium]
MYTKRTIIGGVLGALLATTACDKTSRDAGAFTSAGVTHLQQGENDRAIRDFDRAIALRPGLVVAWRNRGLAYRSKGDFERALADYDQATLLAPADARLYVDRGQVYLATNDHARAIQDFDRAVGMKPDLAVAFEYRGKTNFLLGNLAQAAADLQRELSFDSTNASVVLWLHVARQRLKQDDAGDFEAQAARVDSTRWPAPVIQYFLGSLTLEALRAAAADTTAAGAKDEGCTVGFYLGEEAIVHGRHDDARTLLEETRANCPKELNEQRAAVAELKRLGAKR